MSDLTDPHGNVRVDSLKRRLKDALTAAMRARDDIALSSLRQALSALAVAETSGTQLAVLPESAVLTVLAAEIRKHHETADAFTAAGRPEKAERERAEAAVLEAYMPRTLGADELDQVIRREISSAHHDGLLGMKAMGRVVAAVRVAAGPTADGAAIAARVKELLA